MSDEIAPSSNSLTEQLAKSLSSGAAASVEEPEDDTSD
ncbi:hypothetical protein ABH925_007158 [Streptacidiphilus sp. EB129]